MVNYQQKVVHLDEGMRLGQVELVSEEECDSLEDMTSGSEDGNMGSGSGESQGGSIANQGDEAIVSDGARIGEAEAGGCVAVVSGDVIAKKQRLRESVKWPQQLEQLQQLVEEYHEVFALAEDEMGCTDVVKHKIDTGDHPPIKQYPRRTPFVQRAKIASMITDMEKKGIVKLSVSPSQCT